MGAFDGLVAHEYDLSADRPCIRGPVYWLGGPGPSRFTLFIGSIAGAATSDSDIDWSTMLALIPADDMTGWLTVDTGDDTLVMDPSTAYPAPA